MAVNLIGISEGICHYKQVIAPGSFPTSFPPWAAGLREVKGQVLRLDLIQGNQLWGEEWASPLSPLARSAAGGGACISRAGNAAEQHMALPPAAAVRLRSEMLLFPVRVEPVIIGLT